MREFAATANAFRRVQREIDERKLCELDKWNLVRRQGLLDRRASQKT